MGKEKNKKLKKYKRHFNVRRIKRNLSYSTQEIADLLGTTRNAVNSWYKRGLEKNDDRKMPLVFGENLINFLNHQRTKGKQKCAPDEFYCCKCKVPCKAWENLVDIKYIDAKRIAISGLCEKCSTEMYRLAAAKNIEELKKVFNIQMIQDKQL
ncbi:MAG: hypothetical protein A2X78_03070 [Gammaproteobacteria bacterium GWE2_37_16]|nr:MAG: hypothetical protein A2X78_03070 [Gammaproteobacteria bacterium GWE2_37_16]